MRIARSLTGLAVGAPLQLLPVVGVAAVEEGGVLNTDRPPAVTAVVPPAVTAAPLPADCSTS